MTVDRALLKRNELFTTLDDGEAAMLAKKAVSRTYLAGEEIFQENEEAYAICVLLEGRVGLMMDVGNGRRLTVTTVEPGEIFAWSGLVAPYQFTSTARAVEDCTMAAFKSEDLRRMFDENPRLGYQVMRQISFLIAQRLRDTHLQLLGLFGS
ncbi:MAG: cyclic nucleotide-binding domain-containing protein [Actinobacteria bacterium]|nr:cyclic nucleotide-binding domain-containing protein [Actinomycetota bacterium]